MGGAMPHEGTSAAGAWGAAEALCLAEPAGSDVHARAYVRKYAQLENLVHMLVHPEQFRAVPYSAISITCGR